MKSLQVCLISVCLFASCNTDNTKSASTNDTAAATTTTSSNESVNYAYTPMYSGDFEIGDSKYAQTVLELWKDFDNNTFDNHKDAFADSVAMDFPDGSTSSGTRDSIISGAKAYRNSFKKVVSSVEAITTLKPKGKDETWVCVWGKAINTHNDGKTDSVHYNENWMFNKDGKIVYMSQYSAKPPVVKK